MKRYVLVTDLDETLTTSDSIFDFFDLFGKTKEAKLLYKWSLNSPERISEKYGIPLNKIYPSMDVELVLKEILKNREIPTSVFEKLAKRTKFAKGARELVRSSKSLCEVFVLTCAYRPLAILLTRRLGVKKENVFSTNLRISKGKVAGFVGPIMDAETKATQIAEIQRITKVPLKRFIGLGDSASDAPFIGRITAAGGLGLAVKKQRQLESIGANFVKNLPEAIQEIKNFVQVMK